MKRLGILLFAALIAAGTIGEVRGQEPEKKNKVTHNKATKTTGKGVKKAGKGIEHGAYDVSHNKATKETDINKGNKKYKNSDDVNLKKE